MVQRHRGAEKKKDCIIDISCGFLREEKARMLSTPTVVTGAAFGTGRASEVLKGLVAEFAGRAPMSPTPGLTTV